MKSECLSLDAQFLTFLSTPIMAKRKQDKADDTSDNEDASDRVCPFPVISLYPYVVSDLIFVVEPRRCGFRIL